jgi:hypothetical protein
MFPVLEFVKELEEERDFLINTFAHTYEKEELLNLAGRIYELNKVIKKLYEMEG